MCHLFRCIFDIKKIFAADISNMWLCYRIDSSVVWFDCRREVAGLFNNFRVSTAPAIHTDQAW